MKPTPFSVFRCPYCASRRGVIAIDCEAIQALADSPLRSTGPGQKAVIPSHDIDVSAGSLGQPFVVFGACDRPLKASKQTLCPHLIGLLIDIDVFHATQRGEIGEPAASLCASWDHPWLLKQDPDEELRPFLWTEVGEEPGDTFTPRNRWYLAPLRQVISQRRSRSQIVVSGTAIVAIEPVAFLREVRREFNREKARYAASS